MACCPESLSSVVEGVQKQATSQAASAAENDGIGSEDQLLECPGALNPLSVIELVEVAGAQGFVNGCEINPDAA